MIFSKLLFFCGFFAFVFVFSFLLFYYFFKIKNNELQNTILVSFSCGMVVQLSSFGFISSFLLGALVASTVVFFFRVVNIIEYKIKKNLKKKRMKCPYSFSLEEKDLENSIQNTIQDQVVYYKSVLFSACSALVCTILFIQKVHP